jgi:chromosomal replication initiator protein
MRKDQLWKAALGQLELRVSQVNFLTWFRNTKIKERRQGSITIETNSPFIYEWLSKKYHSLILEVLKGLDKNIDNISFAVVSQPVQRKSFKKNMRIVAHKQRPSTPAPQVGAVSHLSTEHSPMVIRPRPLHSRQSSIQFNPKYTFDNFVVGPSNEIAHAACRAVVDKPGEAYNPLFIYGGVGLGKTHLLQAVGNTLIAANPVFKILYVTSEKFMNEFVEALRERKMQEFKKTYRDLDMFIIDDVQFLAGKDKTQEELFHTFNALHGQNKQVILSSDRPPSAISALQERLSSRLAAGMIADVKKPDYETRLAILEEKAGRSVKDVQIESKALEFIAKNIQNNVRELEGALNRVIAHGELHKQRVTVEYAKKVLSDLIDQSHRKVISTKHIIDIVSVYYNLSTDQICGKRRNKEIVRPRQIAMYLLRKENKMSFPSIGEYFGGRDHTTAMHACEKIEKLLEHDEELGQEINFLRERLYV